MTTVTLIPGDGIGPEVSEATQRAVDALGTGISWDVHDAGVLAIETHGNPLPPHVVDSIKANKVAIKGPVTTPVGTGFRSINVALRQELDLFASVRPCKLYEGVPSRYEEVDIIVVRENTEDLYEGIEFEMGSPELDKLRGFLKYMYNFPIAKDAGVSVKPISITATRDIVTFAFELATKHGRKKLTLGHKANIMKFSDGVWLETGQKTSGNYPDVEFDAMQVDEMAMYLAWIPGDLDMVVLPNLYGDIISDICAGLVGGLGVAPGMNLGKEYAVFEPTHGSAPDIAGQGIANPLAMMLSATLMLRHLELDEDAGVLERAISKVLRERKVIPADLRPKGQPATTEAITNAVINAFDSDL
jgi:isocitrate dehydrogenase (NAD+)